MPVAQPGQKYAWPDTSPNRLSMSAIRLKMKTTRISVSRPPGRFRSTTIAKHLAEMSLLLTTTGLENFIKDLLMIQ